MPTLEIEVSGKVVSSSLSEFAEAFREQLAELTTDLKTDEDFGQAEQDVKSLKTVEKALTDAKAKALEQAEEVNRLFVNIDELSGEAREARLTMERQIKSRKAEVKTELVEDGISRIEADERKVFRLDFEEALKQKRNLKSMREAIDKVVVTTNARIEQARSLIDAAEEETPGLVPDKRSLEIWPIEKLEMELIRRKDMKAAREAKAKAEEEARKAREEAAKAKAEAEEAAKPAPLPPKSAAEPEIESPEMERHPVEGMTAEEEWKQFASVVQHVFRELKQHKERLIYPENQEKGTRFGQGVNQAWKGVTQ
ncbi:hypothetical protein [Roseibacillus ishigakijimensis]|uniref:DUF1351 domain-containing protein n=1 Tax=Roseibacillus ishigakijimensis TaxID=454146 RepID=A0A934RVQ6_9BACT|nr:hypothetical protein [Roseibacillus ishigakijimensis]MBK1835035.1 hypothetical protein [Roseibacillus ishigakijimensis]